MRNTHKKSNISLVIAIIALAISFVSSGAFIAAKHQAQVYQEQTKRFKNELNDYKKKYATPTFEDGSASNLKEYKETDGTLKYSGVDDSNPMEEQVQEYYNN